MTNNNKIKSEFEIVRRIFITESEPTGNIKLLQRNEITAEGKAFSSIRKRYQLRWNLH